MELFVETFQHLQINEANISNDKNQQKLLNKKVDQGHMTPQQLYIYSKN